MPYTGRARQTVGAMEHYDTLIQQSTACHCTLSIRPASHGARIASSLHGTTPAAPIAQTRKAKNSRGRPSTAILLVVTVLIRSQLEVSLPSTGDSS